MKDIATQVKEFQNNQVCIDLKNEILQILNRDEIITETSIKERISLYFDPSLKSKDGSWLSNFEIMERWIQSLVSFNISVGE